VIIQAIITVNVLLLTAKRLELERIAVFLKRVRPTSRPRSECDSHYNWQMWKCSWKDYWRRAISSVRVKKIIIRNIE